MGNALVCGFLLDDLLGSDVNIYGQMFKWSDSENYCRNFVV